jgi:hypothetical protein
MLFLQLIIIYMGYQCHYYSLQSSLSGVHQFFHSAEISGGRGFQEPINYFE